MLALSATTCKQVAVSLETTMGCRRIRFLQAQEGYYCTFSLINNTHTINSFNVHLTNFAVYITYSYLLNPYWEFTSKLLFNTLSYFICGSTQDICGSTPSVGAMSTELFLYSTLYKNHTSDLHTQWQIFSAPLSCALSLQHLSYKTLYALNCRGHPCTQLGLNLKP